MNKKTALTTIVLLALVLTLVASMTACKLNLGNPLDITYDGTSLQWEEVLGADHYLVQIEGDADREIYGTSMAYDAAGQNFTVSVIAMPKNDKIVKSNITTKDFICLPTIADVKVSDNGVLSWSAISGATGYVVNVNGVAQKPVELTTYDKLPVGEEISVAVRPIVKDGAGNDYSYWSATKRMMILNTPQNVSYDNSKITWNSVSNASNYKVIVNSEEKSGTFGTSLVYNANNSDFDCEVQAIGDHSFTYDSALSSKERFIYLDTIPELKIEDGIIAWDGIANATSYDVKLVYGGLEEIRNVTASNITNLPENVNMQVSVSPRCDGTNFFSSYSAEKTVEFLGTPSLLWDNGVMPLEGSYNNIYWNVINQATGYNVQVQKPDGQIQNFQLGGTLETNPAFDYDFSATGTYVVKVKATIAPGTGLYDSAYSKQIEVVRLPAPLAAAKNAIVSNATTFGDGFTVTYQSVSNALKYELAFNNADASKESTGLSMKVNADDIPFIGAETEAKEIACHIRSVGKGSETIDNRIVVTLSSKETYDFAITIAATPSNVKMAGYYLNWTANSGIGYGYSVTSGSSDFHTSIDNDKYDMSYLQKGDYEVAVCAKGNGANVLASKYSTPINVTRLGEVKNVRVDTSTKEGLLTFDFFSGDEAPYVTYKVQYGSDDSEMLEYTSTFNVNGHISTTGTNIIVRAECNMYNDTETVYYMSSRASDNTHMYYKLDNPTFDKFVAFAGQSYFTWNAPTNASPAEWSASYEVKYGSSTKNTNTNSISLATLEAGYYQFKVKALGDGVKYVNSDMSYNDYSLITKLATPVVTVKDNKYTWEKVENDVAGYIITVDGKETIVDKDTTSFVPTFTKTGYVTVSIKAKGTGQGAGTIDSKPFSKSQRVLSLATPTYTVERIQDAGTYYGKAVAANSLLIKVTNPTGAGLAYCTSYQVKVDGTPKGTATFLAKDGDNPVYVITLAGVPDITRVNVSVKALGVVFDANGYAYIDSTYGAVNNPN